MWGKGLPAGMLSTKESTKPQAQCLLLSILVWFLTLIITTDCLYQGVQDSGPVNVFLGMSFPGYISAAIFIPVIWNVKICLGFLSYFSSQREKINLGIKPTTSLWIQDASCSFVSLGGFALFMPKFEELAVSYYCSVSRSGWISFSLFRHGYWFFFDNMKSCNLHASTINASAKGRVVTDMRRKS